MTTRQYNKIVIGFVVQRYVDGRCTNQEFIGGDEASYEDPDNGEPVEVDLASEKDQPMEMVQPCPVIKQFIHDGGLDTEGVEDVADLVERATKQMDRAASPYVIHNILFETVDGKFYAGVITGEFKEQALDSVERALDKVLGNRIQQLNLEDATVEDRVHAKMTALAECRTANVSLTENID